MLVDAVIMPIICSKKCLKVMKHLEWSDERYNNDRKFIVAILMRFRMPSRQMRCWIWRAFCGVCLRTDDNSDNKKKMKVVYVFSYIKLLMNIACALNLVTKHSFFLVKSGICNEWKRVAVRWSHGQRQSYSRLTEI